MESGMNGNRMPMCDELEEKADTLEGVADEMESVEANLAESDEEEEEEISEEEILKLLDEDHKADGGIDAYIEMVLERENAHYADLSQEGKDELYDRKQEDLVDAKRFDGAEARKRELEDSEESWIEEVAGEVEQFTSIEVG
jgi:hypothetical protein